MHLSCDSERERSRARVQHMRVLVACHSAAPEALGGGERSLLALARAWRRDRPTDELVFLVPEAGGLLAPAIESIGFEVVIVHSYPWVLRQPATEAERLLRYQQGNAAALGTITALIEDRSIDLVMTNTIVNPWSAVAASLTGRPHVWFVREYGERDHGLRFQYGENATFSDIANMSDLVVTNSRAVDDFVRGFAPSARSTVLYPSVEPVSGGAQELRPRGRRLRVLALGKVSESKGQRDLIEAVALLRGSGLDVEASIVGPANPVGYAEELRAAASAAGVADLISITGPVDDPAGLFPSHDVGVTSSRSEAFGRVTLEYLQHGLPVVGARSGGTTELILDDVNGFLYEPGAAAQLAVALGAIADDPELQRRLSEGAVGSATRIVAESQSISDVIEQIVQVTSEAPAARRRMPQFFVQQMAQAAVPAKVLSAAASRPATSAKSQSRPAPASRPSEDVPIRERLILTAAAAGLVQRGFVNKEYYERLSGIRFTSAYSAALHFVRKGLQAGLAPSPRLEPEWARAALGVTARRVVVSLAVHGERAFGHGKAPDGAGPDSSAFSPSRTVSAETLAAGFADPDGRTGTFPERIGALSDASFALRPEVSSALSGTNWDDVRGRERVGGRVSVIVVAYKDWRLTVAAVRAVLVNSGSSDIEVILVDNGSSAPVRRILRGAFADDARVQVLALPVNTNFSGGNNFGFAASSGEHVVFLNNDTKVEEGWLEPLIAGLGDPEVRGLQPLLLYPDGLVQTAGTVFGRNGVLPWHFLAAHNESDVPHLVNGELDGLQAVTAACFAVRAAEFATVGGFDELYANGMEDVDLCFRLVGEFGGAFRTEASSRVIHFEGAASGRGAATTYNRQRFLDRWRDRPVRDDTWRYEALGLAVAGFTLRDGKRGQEASAWGQDPIVVRSVKTAPRAAIRLPYVDRAGSVLPETRAVAEQFADLLQSQGWGVALDSPTQRYRRTRHLDDVVFHFATDKHPNYQPGATNVVITDGPDGLPAANQHLVTARLRPVGEEPASSQVAEIARIADVALRGGGAAGDRPVQGAATEA